jgi:hypothetical protein
MGEATDLQHPVVMHAEESAAKVCIYTYFVDAHTHIILFTSISTGFHISLKLKVVDDPHQRNTWLV